MGFINPGKDNSNNSRGLRRNVKHYPKTITKARSRVQSQGTSAVLNTYGICSTAQSTDSQSATIKPKTQIHHEKPVYSHYSGSKFESLPTEILHKVFLEALNPSLAQCSLLLAYVLRGTHIQIQYLVARKNEPDHLSKIFLYRFFTLEFLTTYEYWFNERLDAKNTAIPGRLTSIPNDYGFLRLFDELVSRGATCGSETDFHKENLYTALQNGDRSVLLALLKDKTFRPEARCLQLFIAHSIDAVEDLDICQTLICRGMDMSDGIVWRQAIDRDGKIDFLEFLLSQGLTPPSEVLGEISNLSAGKNIHPCLLLRCFNSCA
ncbi:hypothetical protein EDC01DRAFT_51706 [Geopyxis carbonaria]|nr:hypothetical protein EDC01DRAFT_51706 [Geopyxis carbonaria]